MSLTIKPTPPFDFDLSAKIFSGGDKEICKYADGKYWRVLRTRDKLILVVVESTGSVNKPELSVELKSDKKISKNDKKIAEEIVCSLFDLKLDLNPFYETIKDDEIMLELTRKLYGLKSGITPTVFEALVCSILEQQISLNVVSRIEKRFIKRFGNPLKIDNEIYYAFPLPKKLAIASLEEIQKCGTTKRKSEYIRDTSRLIIEGKLDLEKLRSKRSEEIVEELCKVRGIGVWTAELTMVRGMHKLDVTPADDLGLRRHISHYYCNDKKISGDDAHKIAKKWGDWKGLASFYLIMAGRLGIK